MEVQKEVKEKGVVKHGDFIMKLRDYIFDTFPSTSLTNTNLPINQSLKIIFDFFNVTTEVRTFEFYADYVLSVEAYFDYCIHFNQKQ